MIRDITLGQYFAADSVIHKLDPRGKILLLIMYIVALFMADSFFSYLFLAVTVVTFVILSKIPLRMYLRGLRPLLIIILLTAILNIFFSSGNVVFSFWIIKITDRGIINAVSMISRIFMLVIVTSMLTYTTSPIVLTSGLERLLSPLQKIKIPVHEFSMMLTIALRFIPTILEETDKIMNAQKARGADFESGNLVKRAKALVPIIIPLFISAFRRADELAVAMECRCYSGNSSSRTRYIRYRFKTSDFVAFVILAAMIAGVVFLNTLKIGFLGI